MSNIVRLFPDLPDDLKEGDLVWLPRFASFGTIMTIRRSGELEIAIQGATLTLHALSSRHEIHTASEAEFTTAASAYS